jgi:acylphosphatase
MSEKELEVEFTIAGRVQMVMFREFAKRKAAKLKLRGFVKNNDNGTVTVVAQGGEQNLKEYGEYLKKGSMFAKVSGITKSERLIEKKYSNFEITY